MARFLPIQLEMWTGGHLYQTEEAARDAERHYTAICKDTRIMQADEAYIALVGPHFDGHDFAEQALQKGALLLILQADSKTTGSLLQRQARGELTADLLVVPDTWQAYQDLAHRYRLSLSASVIGVTGSVGKTTTRRMIHCMIAPQMKAMQTYANQNNEIGLSQTLLNAAPDDQVLVTEIAMDRQGEISKLSAIARPDFAVITTIGHSHAEYLGTVRAILEEKTSILDSMKDNGLCIINGEDPMLFSWAVQKPRRMAVWLVVNQENAGRMEREGFPAFWAEDVRLTAEQTTFTARSSFSPSERWPVSIPMPGRHLVPAALFGLALAYALGLDVAAAAAAARNFAPEDGRQWIEKAGAVVVMDDSYNASPESCFAALATLDLLTQGRKIVVFGAMRELGKYSEAQHRLVGHALIDHGVDTVYVIGDEAQPLVETVQQGSSRTQVSSFSDLLTLQEQLLQDLRGGDTVLLKGSRFFGLEVLAQAIKDWTAR